MVGVGRDSSGFGMTEMEIIDLESTSPKTCQNLANFPLGISAAFGILGLNNKPTICGGSHRDGTNKDCYTYENNLWNKSSSMESVRVSAAASLSPYPNKSDNFFVSGGYGGNNFVSSVEELNNGNWTIQTTKKLPVTMAYHCMVLFNSTTVLAIGGYQEGSDSGRTYFFNTQNENWIEGPQLKYARKLHTCAMIKTSQQNDKLSVIAVGGFINTHLSSVEILEEGSSQWRDGPNLPLAIAAGMMVADSNNGVVQIGGYSPSVGYSDKLFHLTAANAEWIEMPQKLKQGRVYGVAILVPNDITNCS